MPETNPAEAAGNDEPLSVDDGADAIADILKDPETDLAEEDQGEQEATEEAEAEGDEPEAEETEEATEKDPEEEEGPQDNYESGKFAADTANVRLKDGSVISVQDLKRGFLSQASFTRGTQENARERETLASQKAEVEQYARSLQEQRDFILQASQQFLPTAPDERLLDANSASYDPLRYVSEKAAYDKRVDVLRQLHSAAQTNQSRATQEQQRQQTEMQALESQRLLEAMPELKKPEVAKKFWADSVETMAEYGFGEDELKAAMDHRIYRVFRDLAAYRRARKSLPSIKQAVQSKPVLSGQKRMDPKLKSTREQQGRREQLRRTGDFDAGVNALMDLDL